MAILTSLFIPPPESDSSSNRMSITPDFIRHPFIMCATHPPCVSVSLLCRLSIGIFFSFALNLQLEIININQLTFLPRVILTRPLC